MTRAVIYAAKSTQDKNLSIPEQLADCREMCKENGWTIRDEFKDEDFTAYTGNRGPGLAAAIELAKTTAAETGEQVFIVAQHTSRFARGDGASFGAPKALVELWHEWARSNVRGRLVENDDAMATSQAAAAQGHADHEYSKRLSRSVKKGLRRRARDRGGLSTGQRPYGYCWLDGVLEVIEHEVAVVRRIYDEYLSGRSQQAIAVSLNRDGIRPAIADKWAQPSVRRVLTNPIYVGKIRHVGELYKGTHDAILDEATFDAAQELMETKETKHGRGAPRGSNRGGGREPVGNHLFTKGLLRCGRCGEAMTPRTWRTGVEVYVCLGRKHDKDSCDQMPVPREPIDESMLNELEKRWLNLAATRDRLRARRMAEAAMASEALAAARSEALRAADRLMRIQAALQDGFLEPADYAEQRASLIPQREAADAAVARIEERIASLPSDDATNEVIERLRSIRATVLGGIEKAPDLPALRKLLRRLFEMVLYQAATDGPVLFLGINAGMLPDGTNANRQPLDLAVTREEAEALFAPVAVGERDF